MPLIMFRNPEDTSYKEVESGHPLPVEIIVHDIRSPLTSGNQYGLSITSATTVALIVPDNAKAAEIYVRTASVVFTRGTANPTATRGFQADATDIILLNSRDELLNFGAIAVSATATLDVEYFDQEVR